MVLPPILNFRKISRKRNPYYPIQQRLLSYSLKGGECLMGAGFHGKFNNTKGAKEAANTRQSLPQNNAQLKHIFSGKDGHLTDTPQNRQLLSDLANDTSKLAGKDNQENAAHLRQHHCAALQEEYTLPIQTHQERRTRIRV